MRRKRQNKHEVIRDEVNIQTKIITEDDIVNCIDKQHGLVMTRKIHNQNNIDYNNVKIVCLTGYDRIINKFFNNYVKKLIHKVTLVLIESDIINLSTSQIENDKIKQIYMWNKNINHPKVNCLPIGLNKDRHINLINLENLESKSEKLLLINYKECNHPIRSKLMEKAKNEWSSFCSIINYFKVEKRYSIKSFCDGQINVDVTSKDYYELLRDYKFVLSPRGAGEDCHRTWEVLYMEKIPIVISSSIEEIYQDLPVLVIKNWDEINEELLNKTWIEFGKKEWNLDKLMLNYWMDKIVDKKFHFITYSNSVFERAKTRLLKEAEDFGVFTFVKGYGPEDLDEDFSEKYKGVLSYPRGGGYWVWRYHILKKELDKLKENDLLLYIDAGCKLNNKGMKRFNEYVEMLEKSEYGVLSIQMHNQPEKWWTTKEIFKYYDIDVDSDIANSGQYLGGILLMKKNKHCMDFVDYMLKVLEQDMFLFTDKYNNNQGSFFKDNRHDQSVSSIYRKIHGSIVIPEDETFFFSTHPDKKESYPIWAIRSKT